MTNGARAQDYNGGKRHASRVWRGGEGEVGNGAVVIGPEKRRITDGPARACCGNKGKAERTFGRCLSFFIKTRIFLQITETLSSRLLDDFLCKLMKFT